MNLVRHLDSATLKCKIQVCVATDEGFHEALVVQISRQELRVEMEGSCPKGALVTVSLNGSPNGRRAVPCRINWCRRKPRQSRLKVASLVILGNLQELDASWLSPTLAGLEHSEALHRGEWRWQPPVSLSLAAEVDPPDHEPLQEPDLFESPAPQLVEADANPRGDEMDELDQALQAIPSLEEEEEVAPELPSMELEAVFDSHLAGLLSEAKARLQRRSRLLERMLSGLRSFAVEDGVSVMERRRIGRLQCSYELVCQSAQGKVKAHVVDVSPVGIAFESSQPLRKGARVELLPPGGLEFDGTSLVHARVAYSRKLGHAHRTGLIVEDEDLLNTWLGVALRFLGFSRAHLDQRRKFVRARAHLPVEARGWRGDFVPGYFLDLGRGGALLQSPISWNRDEQIRLIIGPLGSLPLLYLSGFVLHQEQAPGSAGWLVRLRFAELDPTRIRQLDRYILALLRAAHP